MTFEEMNPLQRRLHNAALVLEAEGGGHGFAKLQRDAIDGIETLTKDAERYRVGREAEYAGLMPTFRAGRTWADAMDSAYDAAIAAQKEQV